MSRGNQTRGTAIVRPSLSSTVSPSSSTRAFSADGSRNSVPDVVIPKSQQVLGPLFNQRFDPPQFGAAKRSAPFQLYRSKPELGFAFVAFNMHMWRLIRIRRIEKEPVWSTPENSRQDAGILCYARCSIKRRSGRNKLHFVRPSSIFEPINPHAGQPVVVIARSKYGRALAASPLYKYQLPIP